VEENCVHLAASPCNYADFDRAYAASLFASSAGGYLSLFYPDPATSASSEEHKKSSLRPQSQRNSSKNVINGESVMVACVRIRRTFINNPLNHQLFVHKCAYLFFIPEEDDNLKLITTPAPDFIFNNFNKNISPTTTVFANKAIIGQTRSRNNVTKSPGLTTEKKRKKKPTTVATTKTPESIKTTLLSINGYQNDAEEVIEDIEKNSEVEKEERRMLERMARIRRKLLKRGGRFEECLVEADSYNSSFRVCTLWCVNADGCNGGSGVEGHDSLLASGIHTHQLSDTVAAWPARVHRDESDQSLLMKILTSSSHVLLSPLYTLGFLLLLVFVVLGIAVLFALLALVVVTLCGSKRSKNGRNSGIAGTSSTVKSSNRSDLVPVPNNSKSEKQFGLVGEEEEEPGCCCSMIFM
jgi:hypothetical protein